MIEHFVCQNLVEYVYLSVEQKSHVAVFTDPLLVTDREGGRGDVIDRHLSLLLPPVFSFSPLIFLSPFFIGDGGGEGGKELFVTLGEWLLLFPCCVNMKCD